MVNQYPHIAWITTTTNATQDAEGNWESSEGESIQKVKCRAESSSGSGYITGSDGKRIDYSWVVYIPLDASGFIKTGSTISVYQGEDVVVDKDTIKRYSRGQLNIRLWL